MIELSLRRHCNESILSTIVWRRTLSISISILIISNNMHTFICLVNLNTITTLSNWEFKCPFSGKQHVTDVRCRIPVGYALQLILEIAALRVDKHVNVCWTLSPSTAFIVKFCKDLWLPMTSITVETWWSKRPLIWLCEETMHNNTEIMANGEFAEFLGEFSSVKGKEYHHQYLPLNQGHLNCLVEYGKTWHHTRPPC